MRMTRVTRFTRFTRITALVAGGVMAGLAALAAPAAALPPGPPDPAPDPPAKADLWISALSVSPVGSNWSVSYTVANRGTATASASKVAFNGGPGLQTERNVSSLAAGSSSSSSVQLTRTADCFVASTLQPILAGP